VFITADVKFAEQTRSVGAYGNMRIERDFDMSVTGWMAFIMQEPLSGEKMWIKKIDLDPVPEQRHRGDGGGRHLRRRRLRRKIRYGLPARQQDGL